MICLNGRMKKKTITSNNFDLRYLCRSIDMFRKNLALIVFLILIPAVVHATDLEHSVSGDSEIESDLENSKVPNNRYDCSFVLSLSHWFTEIFT